MPTILAFIKKILLETIYQVFSKNTVGRAIFHFEEIFCPYTIHPTFFLFDG